MKEWFKGKGFYISLMAGAICVVAIAAVTLDSFGINKNMSGEKEKNDIAKNIVDKPEVYVEDELAENEEDITKYPIEMPTLIPEKKPGDEEVKENDSIIIAEEKQDKKEKTDKKSKSEKETETKQEEERRYYL